MSTHSDRDPEWEITFTLAAGYDENDAIELYELIEVTSRFHPEHMAPMEDLTPEDYYRLGVGLYRRAWKAKAEREESA